MRFFARTWLCAGLFLIAAAAPAQTGWGLAPDSRGGFTFSDITRDCVWRADAQGHLRLMLDRVHCHTLVPGYDGVVYGEDVGGGSRAGNLLGLWKLASDGRRIDLLPVTLIPDPAVWLVRDATGNSYAWDGNPNNRGTSRILRRSPEGHVAAFAGGDWGFADGSAAQARFGQVQAMAATPDGVLYLVDDGNLRRILIDGTVSTLAHDLVSGAAGGLPGRGGLWNHSMGMAVDAAQRAYIVDYSRDRIVRFHVNEGAKEVHHSGGIGNRISGSSWGWRPTGVSVHAGEFYVMEDWPLPTLLADLVGSPRILRIAPDGSAETLASVSSTGVRFVAVTVLVGVIVLLARFFRRRPAR